MIDVMKAQVLAAACMLVSGAALAQGACPEGRAANGQCVNPNLANAMRQGAVIYAHPKLSYTHYPVLLSADWSVRYPNQLNPDPLPPSAIAAPFRRGP